MEKIKIVLCDTNKKELEGYATICRGICEKAELPVDLKLYTHSGDLLFDMEDISFSATVSVFIVDPENGFEHIPTAVRKNGYDGLILYLSYSSSLEHYRQAFDVGAYNFIQKGTDPQILSRFHEVFEQSLQAAKKRDRQYLVVGNTGEYRKIEVCDIHYFETAMDHMIKVVYKGGSFMFLSTLQELEERFRDRGFVRVHRSYLVAVDSIHRIDAAELTLNNQSKIPVSRSSIPALKAAVYC